MGHTYTDSFLEEVLQGIHDFESDTLKMALYDDTAILGRALTAYTATNEISGSGYTAGGKAMALASGYPQAADDGLGQDYRYDDVEWTSSTLAARQAVIYNSSKSNRAILVLDFGRTRQSVSATLAVRFPLTLPAIIRTRQAA